MTEDSLVQTAFADYWRTLESDQLRVAGRARDLIESAFLAGALWAAERTQFAAARTRMLEIREAAEERRAERADLIRRFEEADVQPADLLDHIEPAPLADREFLSREGRTVGEAVDSLLDECGDTTEWLEEVLGLLIGEEEET